MTTRHIINYKKIIITIIIAVVIYIILGAFLPFVRQPSVSDDTINNFDADIFYSDVQSGERARVISQNGEALEERIRMISQAEDEIILSTFEIDADTSGTKVIAALLEAAERGVNVMLIADGFPYLTAMWGNPYFLALASSENVQIKIYNPIRLWKPWTIMGRLHDKYLIVDDIGYILGGRNTYDYFLGDQEGYKNYDWDVLVYSAEAGEDSSLLTLKDYFYEIWELPVCRTFADNAFWAKLPSVSKAKKELKEAYAELEAEHGDWLEAVDYESETIPVNHIEFISNPTHIFAKEPVAFYEITQLMMQAKISVTFHTPYIICNDWMLERLALVYENVGDVTMMTNSASNNGNLFGASDYYKNRDDILETGVQILEYDGGISYHGKCFVIDDRLSGVGSFNWDMRSAYIDTELMLVIDSKELNTQLRGEMQTYEDEAVAVAIDSTQGVSGGKKALLNIMRLINWARFVF